MTSPAPLRVIYVIESLGRGGAERLLASTIEHLPATRLRCTVAALFSDPSGSSPSGRSLSLAPRIEHAGARVVWLGARRPRDLPFAACRLFRLIRRERPHVVHTHLYWANLVGRPLARLAGVPALFTTLHFPDYDAASVGVRSERRRWLDWLVTRLCGGRYVAVSEDVARSARAHLGVQSPVVLHNALDAAAVSPPDDVAVAAARARLGLPGASPLVVGVGRLHVQKGFRVLVDAVARVSDRRARLALVGDGPERSTLERQAGALGIADRVRFVPATDNVDDWIAAADLLVLPALNEGFGIVLLEAMALGKACVATRVGGIPEVVVDGETGLLVPPGDAGALANALMALLADPALRSRMGSHGRERVVACFDIRPACRRLEDLYRAALAGMSTAPGDALASPREAVR